MIRSQVVGGLGVVTLDRARAVNALSLDMIRDLTSVLRQWASDPSVHGVLMQGSAKVLPDGTLGATHFCAGGDIRFMHEAAISGDLRIDDFFTEEYALDFLIHRYSKPVIAWMEGITMGGGMGLAQGADVRVVAASAKMAMPETRIGLFPDVAGGYFLSRCPGHVGEYLGVTGSHFGAADAIAFGLADVHGPAGGAQPLIDSFAAHPATDAEDLLAKVRSHLNAAGQGALPGAVAHAALHPHRAAIDRHFGLPTLTDIVASLAADDSDWARLTLAHMAGNSPLMMSVALKQIRRARTMTLADVFRMERSMVRHCFGLRRGAASETTEGVRALAIDKDHRPRWNPAHIENVTAAMVDAFFEPAWPDHAHPLRCLYDEG